MVLEIDKDEYWIKDDVIFPSNFNSMNADEKWAYIIDNNLLHKEDGPAIIYSNGTEVWWLNGIEVDEKIYKEIQDSSEVELLVYTALTEYKDYLPLIEHRMNQ